MIGPMPGSDEFNQEMRELEMLILAAAQALRPGASLHMSQAELDDLVARLGRWSKRRAG